MKTFEVTKLIRMQHCDPGGVVFTPQYFNIFVEVLEDFFREALEFSFNQMVVKQKFGTPAMKIVAKFYKPSFMGDVLTFKLQIKRLRRNNVLFQMTAHCAEEKRCVCDLLSGYISLENKVLTDWPDELREKLAEYKIVR